MNDTLKAMIELQEVDRQLQALVDAGEEGPLRLEELNAEWEARKGAHAELLGEAETRRKQMSELKIDIEYRHERAKILESRLMGIKNNAEYQAMLKEIANMKAALDARETEYLQLDEQMEARRAVMDQLAVEMGAIDAEFEERKRRIEERVQSAREEFERRQAERAPFLARIDARTLKIYNDLRHARRGVAVVGIYQYICRGCNIHIPPNIYNQIIAGSTLHQCTQCKRFLYYDPPAKVNEASAPAPEAEPGE